MGPDDILWETEVLLGKFYGPARDRFEQHLADTATA
jgi:hypothetical protein